MLHVCRGGERGSQTRTHDSGQEPGRENVSEILTPDLDLEGSKPGKRIPGSVSATVGFVASDTGPAHRPQPVGASSFLGNSPCPGRRSRFEDAAGLLALLLVLLAGLGVAVQ